MGLCQLWLKFERLKGSEMLHVVCLFTSLPCIALLLNFNRAALANHFPFSFVDILCLDDDSDEDDFYDVASSLGNSSGV